MLCVLSIAIACSAQAGKQHPGTTKAKPAAATAVRVTPNFIQTGSLRILIVAIYPTPSHPGIARSQIESIYLRNKKRGRIPSPVPRFHIRFRRLL
jgi:hypothetical protein